jgi:DNA primase
MSTGMCASLKPRDTSSNKTTSTEVVSSDSSPEADVQRVINAPLDFELKSIDAQHLYLSQRGLTPETIAHFGLGVCSRGLMKDRAVIPLHDVHGQLIGYAGRRIKDDSVDDDSPKYLLPGSV